MILCLELLFFATIKYIHDDKSIILPLDIFSSNNFVHTVEVRRAISARTPIHYHKDGFNTSFPAFKKLLGQINMKKCTV